MKATTQEIITSINLNPSAWSMDEHYFVHNSGFKIWIKSGFYMLHCDEPRYNPSLMNRIKIWKAIKSWRHNHIKTKLRS